jgi:hypothetical protein
MHKVEAERRRRAAANQSLFRSVNEKIKELNDIFDAFTPYGEWTCECDRLDCITRIELTLGEYEELRQNPTRFAVAPEADHVDPEVERVVAETERYWIVEKLGVGGELAIELDGRHA